MPGNATPIFLSFYVTFLNSESGLEINGCSYVLIFTVFTRNQVDNITAVTTQITSDIIKPTSNLKLKVIISYQIIFADVTFLTRCYTTFTILRFGRKQGDKISFMFFSLLYKVLIDLDGKILFIFSSVCNTDILF